MRYDFNLPYLLSYSPVDVEAFAIFFVAMLTAVLVSAEGQAFAATLLGDSRPDAKDRLHFNVFLHLSIPGTINFFVAGFAWSKQMSIDVTRFQSNPGLRLILSRLAGPFANFIMANIAASLNWILGRYSVQDEVFSTIVIVNVTMAVYNLIIFPPLPGFALLEAIFPDSVFFERVKRLLVNFGPYLIVAFFLVVRLSGWDGVAKLFNPVVLYVTNLIMT